MSAKARTRLFLFFIFVALAAGAFFAHWWLVSRHYQSTNNAYVHGDITRVSSQLAAQISEVLVTDNQIVQQGDLLVRLDDRDFDIALARANANLATREAERLEAQSRLAQQDSLIEAAKLMYRPGRPTIAASSWISNVSLRCKSPALPPKSS